MASEEQREVSNIFPAQDSDLSRDIFSEISKTFYYENSKNFIFKICTRIRQRDVCAQRSQFTFKGCYALKI